MDENQVTDHSTDTSDATSTDAGEKKFTRDQLAKVVAAESAKAADAARRQAEEKYQRELEQLNANAAKNAEAPAGSTNVDDIVQKVSQKLRQEQQDAHAKKQEELAQQHVVQVAQRYLSKLDEGRRDYEDFDEVIKDFDPAEFPQLTYLLSELDNAGDVLYEIANNPAKIATLDQLAQKSDRMAKRALMDISKSIDVNRTAETNAKTRRVSAPLDRMQPSRVSGSNGKMSISELRKQPHLRG